MDVNHQLLDRHRVQLTGLDEAGHDRITGALHAGLVHAIENGVLGTLKTARLETPYGIGQIGGANGNDFTPGEFSQNPIGHGAMTGIAALGIVERPTSSVAFP